MHDNAPHVCMTSSQKVSNRTGVAITLTISISIKREGGLGPSAQVDRPADGPVEQILHTSPD